MRRLLPCGQVLDIPPLSDHTRRAQTKNAAGVCPNMADRAERGELERPPGGREARDTATPGLSGDPDRGSGTILQSQAGYLSSPGFHSVPAWAARRIQDLVLGGRGSVSNLAQPPSILDPTRLQDTALSDLAGTPGLN